MYKNAVISEILYCMALRFKGGLCGRRIWGRKYREYLESVLSCMEFSADLLETDRDLSLEDIQPVIDFVNLNSDKIFSGTRIDIEAFCDENSCLVLVNNCDWDKDDERIIERMRYCISECIKCLGDRKKGYKECVQKLFHKYHNLPRAYLSRVYSPDVQTTFLGRDYSRWALPKSKALEYSDN